MMRILVMALALAFVAGCGADGEPIPPAPKEEKAAE